MKASTTSGHNRALAAALFFAAAFLCVCAPLAHASSAVQFTEVMYNAPGADTGHEWIEVTNTSASGVDITGYKLFESGTNHGLTLVQGTTTLAAGESAIISNDTQKFLLDYPAYTGALFKSPFTLTNTSGSLVLKDKTLATISSLTYSSTMGANGDGNSLHLNASGAWVPGAPNPGSNVPTKAIVKPAPVVAASVSKTAGSKSSTKTSSAKSNSNTYNSAQSGIAAVASAEPLLQNIPTLWLYILGLVALMGLGVAAVLYAKPAPSLAGVETPIAAEEFEIE